MSGPAGIRRSAVVVLALWAISGWATAFHAHGCCGCGDHRHEDEKPCPICLAVAHVPAAPLAKAESVEREREVVVWIAPWIALVPKDVFFDRPLARGPPAIS
jgi:hypothetical protein